jgi:hypothetical protein
MSLWDGGNLKHGKLNLSPHNRWSDALCSPPSPLSEKFPLWLSLLLPLLSLFVVLLLTPEKAHASDDGAGGEGLFALSLEEVLDIEVEPTEHFVPSKDGIYALTSHELLRIYAQPELLEVLSKETSSSVGIEQGGFPVLLNGNYLGTFKDVRSALRFIKQISSKDLRIDLYVGATTVWFEDGRHPVLFDIQDGGELSLVETTTAVSEGAEARHILTPSNTEVLP